MVYMNAEGADGLWYNLWIAVNPEVFRAGGEGSFDWETATGGMGVWDPFRWQWRFMGSFVTGPLRLQRAQMIDGAVVKGSFETWLILWE